MDEHREENSEEPSLGTVQGETQGRLQRLRKNKARIHEPAVPETEELHARRPGLGTNSLHMDKGED